MFISRMVRRKIFCKVVVVVRKVLLFILSYFSGRSVIKVENTSIIHQYWLMIVPVWLDYCNHLISSISKNLQFRVSWTYAIYKFIYRTLLMSFFSCILWNIPIKVFMQENVAYSIWWKEREECYVLCHNFDKSPWCDSMHNFHKVLYWLYFAVVNLLFARNRIYWGYCLQSLSLTLIEDHKSLQSIFMCKIGRV